MRGLALSSGFLAFARHIGVLEAMVVEGVTPDRIVATSSSSLVAALWLSGMDLPAMSRLFSESRPLSFLSPNLRMYRGLFAMGPLRKLLESLLPPTFEELPKPFAVGVCDEKMQHRLLHQGPLVPAVLASMSMPRIFSSVSIGGTDFVDGGVIDRLGLHAAAQLWPNLEWVVHEVERTRGSLAHKSVSFSPKVWIRTPRASASLLGMGPFHFEKEQARTLALSTLRSRA